MIRIVHTILTLVLSIHLLAQTNVNDTLAPVLCEYWIDDRTVDSLLISSNEILFSVDASTLSDGVHTLNYRIKDSNEKYSPLYTWLFYKRLYPLNDTIVPVVCEYWIDTMALESIPMPTNELQFAIDANLIGKGLHTLNYRVKDSEGKYSPLHTWLFYKNNEKSASRIAWCKYWWNNHIDKAVIERIGSDSTTIVFMAELSIPYYAKIDGYSDHSITRLHYQFGDDLGNVSATGYTDISYPDCIPPTSAIEIDSTAQIAGDEVVLKWHILNDQEGDYNIYYSENEEPFVLWLANTTLKTIRFKMREGISYRFTVTARDKDGNAERLDEAKYIFVK